MPAAYLLTETGVRRSADNALIPADTANADYRDYLAWVGAGGVADPYVAPEVAPGTVPPRLVASAFGITIAGGDVTEMSGVFNLVAAIYLDVGQYMLLFIEPQADADYFGVVSGDAPCLRVVDRQADYLIIEARDAVGGNFVDANLISVQAYRF